MTSIVSDDGTIHTNLQGRESFTITLNTSEHFRTAETYQNFLATMFNIQNAGEQALWFGWQIWKAMNNDE